MIQVVKIGGNVVDDEKTLASFIRLFASVQGPKLLVHGGGVMATRMQKQMGQESVMIEGRRVTDEQTLKLVTMVYAGWCSKHITALLQKEGCNAIGLAGCDGNVITAAKRAPRLVNGEAVDYGFIGDVKAEGVNVAFLQTLMNEGITPVLSAINHDGEGGLLNTNADTIASSVAVALAKYSNEPVRLVYCFEKPGVLADKNDDSSLIPVISSADFQSLKLDGTIADGMVPKLENAFAAIAEGVESVTICHALALGGVGTKLVGKR